MKTFLLLLFISVIISSCSTFQYATITGENISKDNKNEFVAESDTLRITYNFNGKKGPVNITIYNKSDIPLQVDWKRSALIIDERPQVYYQPTWNISGDLSTSKGVLPRSTSSTIDARISGNEGEEFIPPHAAISRKGMFIKPGKSFSLPQEISQEKIKVKDVSVKIARGSFTKENSPIVFRSYLTFAPINNPEKIFTTDHSFFISEVVQTMAGPSIIWAEPGKPGNSFFVTGFGYSR
jgi:hypothetical protein